jgi:UTP-glucose-1-phosphate uridylyltransferase
MAPEADQVHAVVVAGGAVDNAQFATVLPDQLRRNVPGRDRRRQLSGTSSNTRVGNVSHRIDTQGT